MFGLENPIHIIFLLAVLLMVFGAKRLPEMGRGLGEGLRGFKDAVSGHQHVAEVTAAPIMPTADTPAMPSAAAPIPTASVEHVAPVAPQATGGAPFQQAA